MAVAEYGSGVAGKTGLGTVVTFNFDVGSGANRLFVVAANDAADSGLVSSVTFNSVSMLSAGSSGSLKAFQLANPDANTNSAAVTLTSYGQAFVAAMAFEGVDQSTPVGSAASASGASNTPSTGSITVPTDGFAWGAEFSTYTTSPAPSIASGALRGSYRDTANGLTVAGGTRSTTGAISWTLGSAAGNWRAVGFPINPAAGASGFSMPPRRAFPAAILNH